MTKLRPPISCDYAKYAPVFAEQRKTGAQLAGGRYERQIIKRLSETFNHLTVEDHPWLVYKCPAKQGICQPDALLWTNPTHCIIVECKLTWQRGARDKLVNFYGPLVTALKPDVVTSYVQIFKHLQSGSHKRQLKFADIPYITEGTYRECHSLA